MNGHRTCSYDCVRPIETKRAAICFLRMNHRGVIVERFDYGHWRAEVGAQHSPVERARLQVTDISVTPESKYRFEVRAGRRLIVSFLFDDLPHAGSALKDMIALLPKIEAARWNRLTK